MSRPVPPGPCGVLILDKPEGPTSHDMVALIRRLLGTHEVGHTGTLDPMATGVLVLCLGRATRLARFLTAGEKVYQARVRLGLATDTYDRTGRHLAPARAVEIDEAQLADVLAGLTGRRSQTPPAFSAKRIGGVRAHRLARAGSPRPPAAVEVTVHGFRDVRLDEADVEFEVRCSAGTYVRSLAQELGERLGCGAHLTALRRIRNGEFGVEEAHTPASLERMEAAHRATDAIVPPGRLRLGMPAVRVTQEALVRLAHGGSLASGDWQGSLPGEDERCRILAPDGALAAVAALDQRPGAAPRLLPRVVLLTPDEVAGDRGGAAETT